MNRNAQIIRTSVVGIVTNVLLAAFKAAVGVLASSIAIIMDAVNNLSDALSSVITIILMVPTGIAGFYGMNVPNGMESWIWGFLFAIVLSVILSILIYVYLKRKKLI